MKTRAIAVIICIWFLIFLLMNIQADCQVLYSSWASSQVRHSVEVEKPKVQYDTVTAYTAIGPQAVEIISTFLYKEFTITVFHRDQILLKVHSGSTQVMLRPDDEFAILEKLISQIR